MSKKKKKKKAGSAAPVTGLNAARKATKAGAKQAAPKSVNARNNHSTPIEEKTMTKTNFDKITADTAALNKDQMDAFVKSSTLFMKGTEDLLKTYMSLAQDSVQKSSEAVKTLLACKTLNELTEAQNQLAQESFDGFVSGATKLSELSVKVATETFEPLNAQLSKNIKKATESAAA